MPRGPRRLPLHLLRGSARRGKQAVRLGLASLALLVVAGAVQAQVIVAARYTEPTSRYAHDVLGTDAEWGALVLTLADCIECGQPNSRDITIRLDLSRVFEDLAPRLIDLDHDNHPEVVTIESDASRGARLAIYDQSGLITATPFIGTAYRWLAPLGAADLDGDGHMELAYIDRPHLAKTLRIWRYQNRKLSQIAHLPGLTNHRIGQDFISGGIRDCGSTPEIITADARWRSIMAARLNGTELEAARIGTFSGPQSLDDALICQ